MGGFYLIILPDNLKGRFFGRITGIVEHQTEQVSNDGLHQCCGRHDKFEYDVMVN